jgi:hypothetical protein
MRFRRSRAEMVFVMPGDFSPLAYHFQKQQQCRSCVTFPQASWGLAVHTGFDDPPQAVLTTMNHTGS